VRPASELELARCGRFEEEALRDAERGLAGEAESVGGGGGGPGADDGWLADVPASKQMPPPLFGASAPGQAAAGPVGPELRVYGGAGGEVAEEPSAVPYTAATRLLLVGEGNLSPGRCSHSTPLRIFH
jgi:hypothetical protein